MIDFLISNPILIITLIFLVMLIVVKLFFSTSSKKKIEPAIKPKDSNEDVNQESPIEKNDEPEQKTKLIFRRKKEGKTEKKLKKPKEKPKITKVYERVETKSKKEQEKQIEPEISEDELLKRMQFVKTTKRVSKLVNNNNVNETLDAESENIEEPIIHEHKGDGPCVLEELSKTTHGHFDRSRRLSRCVRDDNFDEMFSSHISDDYLNINVDKHLKIDDKFSESLYERASKTLANSGAKVLVNDENDISKVASIRSDKDSMRAWLEDRRREELANFMINSSAEENETVANDVKFDDDIELNAKSLIVSQIVMNRKKISKH